MDLKNNLQFADPQSVQQADMLEYLKTLSPTERTELLGELYTEMETWRNEQILKATLENEYRLQSGYRPTRQKLISYAISQLNIPFILFNQFLATSNIIFCQRQWINNQVNKYN